MIAADTKISCDDQVGVSLAWARRWW